MNLSWTLCRHVCVIAALLDMSTINDPTASDDGGTELNRVACCDKLLKMTTVLE